MELLNTLISRHSVRTYNSEPLLSSDLEKILKAAKAAPVGLGLYDQMHLTVVNNQDFIANANTATAAIMHREGTTPTYNVPTLIFVSAKKQNPMFTAVSNTPDLLSKQNLPDDYELLAAIGVGPTSETYEAREIPKDRISVNVVD